MFTIGLCLGFVALLIELARKYNKFVADYNRNECCRANASVQREYTRRIRILQRLQSLELNQENKGQILFLIAEYQS